MATERPRWLLLILSVPPHPSSLRVRTWRRLRALGAVALKSSVYLLPATDAHHEQFQWLAQEVKTAGGEATLVRVDRIENLPPAEVIHLFQEARDRDWEGFADRYRRLLRAADRRAAGPALERRREEARRLAREAERLRQIDFFAAPKAREAERLREAVEGRLRPAGPRRPAGRVPRLEGLRGRRWVTRPRPHIDRVASAWLIRRFVDPEAEILFAEPEAFPADAIPFDAPGVELGHHGEDCTFETLLARAGLADKRLGRLAEIVHEADLGDEKFHRPEAPGIELTARGLLALFADDREVLAHGMTLFDALYAALAARTPRRAEPGGGGS
jgi:hypothetical protein